MKSFKIYGGDYDVSYEMTEEKKNKIINKIIEYAKEHNCISAEHLMQDDKCMIDSYSLMADIIEIFEFNCD